MCREVAIVFQSILRCEGIKVNDDATRSARDKADVRLLHAALLAQVPVGARLALSCDYDQEDERLSVEEAAARIDRVLPCALPA